MTATGPSDAAGRLRIRRNTPEDATRLFALWHAAVEATHHFLSPADRSEIAAMVRDDYLPAAELWVASDAADCPVAFLGMTGAHVDALFVDPAHHGRGVGRALMDFARARHAVLTVDVNEQNPRAVGFYERLGFVRTGRSPTDDQGRPFPLLHFRLEASGNG
ncbi:acetyltransferase [Sphingosinithalassobacter sp. LHW66-3]|uniref:acetyltransferase n=1 Tax=Sphingosinithalassobacter sp. LHW66-3 TaxID=3424718 RepID=UPI003D6C45E5